MDIYRAEKIAQDKMAESRNGEWDKEFVLVGATGLIECEWLDPYFGIFRVKGHEGFMRTSDVPQGVHIVMADKPVAYSEHGSRK